MEMLSKIRKKAKEIMEKTPYQRIRDSPTIKYYAKWEYINKLNIISHEPKASHTQIPKSFISDKHYTIVLNGNRIDYYGTMPQGVKIKEIDEKTAMEFKDYVFKNVSPREDKLIATHLAYFSKGILLIISGEEVLKTPIRIIGFTSHSNTHVGYHVVYVLKSEAKAEIEFISLGVGGKDVLKTFVIEGHVEEHAKLKAYLLTSDSGTSYTYFLHRTRSYGNNACNTLQFVLGENVTHVREEHILASHSMVNVLSLVISAKTSWQDLFTNVVHVGPYSESKVSVKGIALNSSSIIHRGLAKVHRRAKEASTIIESTLLALGNKAKANSIPMLEIETGNVREAKHSTSITRLSEEHLFYMATRGIDEKEAEKLVIKEITSSMLSKLYGNTKALVETLISRKLSIRF